MYRGVEASAKGVGRFSARRRRSAVSDPGPGVRGRVEFEPRLSF